MSNGKKMPDGTICWTGPACKRHGVFFKKTRNLLGKTSYVVKDIPEKNKPKDVDEWMQQMLAEKHKLYTEIYERTQNSVTFEDQNFTPANKSRKGINNENSDGLKQIDSESIQLRMEAEKEDQDVLSHYQSSYEFVNAYLRSGSEGINSLEYLQRTSPHPTKPDTVSDETLDRYVGMANERIEKLDSVLKNYARKNTNAQILHRALFVLEENNPNKLTPQEFIAENYPVGKVIEEKSYLSTSLDSDYMLAYNPHLADKQVVFEIKTNKGTVLHDPDDYAGSIGALEREVLLPRGMKFKVVNVLEATYESTYGEEQLKIVARRKSEFKPKRKFTVVQLEDITE